MSVAVGATATFSVTASGTAPLSYQWSKNSAAISGATNASYTTPATTSADTGAAFTVKVTNSAGSATSNAAILTVTTPPNPPPAIATQPLSQTVTAGQTATFSVALTANTGTSPFTYQWKKNGSTNVGTNSASYTTPTLTTADSGETFKDVITDHDNRVVTSNSATLTVNASGPSGTAPSITTQPASQSALVAATASFSVVATGTAPLSYQWKKNGTAIPGATSASYTTPTIAAADGGAVFTVTVSNAVGNVTSNGATLTVPLTSNGTDVTTFKYDVSRTGTNAGETILTPNNVDASTFGRIGSLGVDGKVDAMPLYLSQLQIGAAKHNVVFIATEHGSVYAFDADQIVQGQAAPAPLWQKNLIAAGRTTSDPLGCTQITPEIGITSTPAIDRSAGAHGVMYVVTMSKDSTNYYQTLHALDVTTGNDVVTAVDISGQFTDVNNNITNFDPKQYEERAALLVTHGQIYLTWTSHCDGYDESVNPNVFTAAYGGWIMSYNQTTLAQTGALNVGPGSASSANTNVSVGPGIWMSGSGPAADSTGSVYLITGNGPFDTTLDVNGSPNGGNYGQSFLKLQGADTGTLSVLDYFSLYNNVTESTTDLDLGSGGWLLLPDMVDTNGITRQLYVGAGKDHNIYMVDRSHLGGFHTDRNHIYQERDNSVSAGVWSSPAFWNNTLFYGPRNGSLSAFTMSNASIQVPAASATSSAFGYPGTSPTVSANGTTNGVVWAYERNTTPVLHAYDATDLTQQLYNTTTNAGRDVLPSQITFVSPVVTGGRVFVPTSASVEVYGLLH